MGCPRGVAKKDLHNNSILDLILCAVEVDRSKSRGPMLGKKIIKMESGSASNMQLPDVDTATPHAED